MLLEKLKADQLAARKAKDANKASLLTTVVGEIETDSRRTGKPTTDADVMATIRKFLKGVDENIRIYSDYRDGENSDRCWAEKTILESYLPTQMSDEQLKEVLRAQLTNKGAMMKFLKENFSGQYDGKLASQVIDELLK